MGRASAAHDALFRPPVQRAAQAPAELPAHGRGGALDHRAGAGQRMAHYELERRSAVGGPAFAPATATRLFESQPIEGSAGDWHRHRGAVPFYR